MKSMLRQPAAFAVGFVAILFLGFAALAQTPFDSAAKQGNPPPPIFAKLSSVGSERCGCFCDAACCAALRGKSGFQTIAGWPRALPPSAWLFDVQPSVFRSAVYRSPVLPKFEWQPPLPKPENEVRAIDLDGLKKLLQRDGKDARPLLLNFWATWCDPCREEFPDLVKLNSDYQNKGLNFIAVSLDDITDINSEVPKFLTQMKATMPVVLLNVKDPEPAIKVVDPTWDGQLPATFLYDKDGKIVFKHFGKIKPDELRVAIDKQISSKQ